MEYDLVVITEKVVGLLYFITGLSLIIQRSWWLDLVEELRASKVAMYFGGFIALMFGLTVVMLHNIWTWSPGVIVTFIGWAAVFKGILLMVWPRAYIQMLPSRETLSKILMIEAPIVEVASLIILWGAYAAA